MLGWRQDAGSGCADSRLRRVNGVVHGRPVVAIGRKPLLVDDEHRHGIGEIAGLLFQRATSTAALRASRLVWNTMLLMTDAILRILAECMGSDSMREIASCTARLPS